MENKKDNPIDKRGELKYLKGGFVAFAPSRKNGTPVRKRPLEEIKKPLPLNPAPLAPKIEAENPEAEPETPEIEASAPEIDKSSSEADSSKKMEFYKYLLCKQCGTIINIYNRDRNARCCNTAMVPLVESDK